MSSKEQGAKQYSERGAHAKVALIESGQVVLDVDNRDDEEGEDSGREEDVHCVAPFDWLTGTIFASYM